MYSNMKIILYHKTRDQYVSSNHTYRMQYSDKFSLIQILAVMPTDTQGEILVVFIVLGIATKNKSHFLIFKSVVFILAVYKASVKIIKISTELKFPFIQCLYLQHE